MNRTIFSLDGFLRLTLSIEPPRFGLVPDDLFHLAVRHNPNRAFLFVSKVLGKHLPIHPSVLPAAGRLLSLALENKASPGPWVDVIRGQNTASFPSLMNLLEKERVFLAPEDATLFLGFAETATGLARAVAACYTGSCAYLSTTRFPVDGCESFTFEESHSHAKTHLLHMPSAHDFLTQCQRIVIVDDEFTTGNTALKLVERLHQRYGFSRFTLLSLLDWSDGISRCALAEQLGIEIEMVSLIHGSIIENTQQALPSLTLNDWQGRSCPPPELRDISDIPACQAGRTLLSAADQDADSRSCQALSQRLGELGADTLVLGTGELIYEPALIAGYCGAAAFHSSTQSPVYPLPGSAIECGVRFDPPDQYSTAGYLYNVPSGRYRRALIFTETKAMRMQGISQLADWLKSRGCGQVEVVAL